MLAALLAPPGAANEMHKSPSSAALIEQAQRFEHGEGVAKDYAKAAELYCAAARQGDPEAAVRLGWMYANGRGVERDDAIAAAAFERAASQGHAHARRLVKLIRADAPHLPECMMPVALAVPAPTALAAPDPVAPSAESEVSDALERWRAAWSGRDADTYLAAYGPGFVVPRGRSRTQWERERRVRIAGKNWIEVTVDDLRISIEGEIAIARFRQDYRSDRYADRGEKTLGFAKGATGWLIERESSDD